jgi:2-polyprenyl-3-methyl-5-hydroxy-6-metoxy-1,4-benzoquinol methylase
MNSTTSSATPCILCASTSPMVMVQEKVKGDTLGALRAVRCVDCGHIQLSPPTYSLEHYKEDGQVNFVVHDYGTPIEKVMEHSEIEARRRLDRFAQHGVALDQPRMRVLDIGGGYGFFGAEFKARHPAFDVQVMEPSPKRAEMGRAHLLARNTGLPVPDFVVEPLNEDYVARFRGTYDVVTMWHVLEHVSDPKDFLRLACALAKPGSGVVCVEVPNADDELMRLSPGFRDRNYMFEHISYFSHQTLQTTAHRAAPGAKVEVHGYQRYGIFNYFHWIHFNKPQGASPDLIEGADRWWLEATWRTAREAAKTSDALFMVIRC